MQFQRCKNASAAEDEKRQREEQHLREAVAREAESVAIGVGIVFGAEGEAADVARVLEIAGVDDVMWAVRAFADALGVHGLHIAGAELAKPKFAKARPGEFDRHARAAAGLDARGFLRSGGERHEKLSASP